MITCKLELVASDRKMNAIRIICDALGLGLKDAKDVVCNQFIDAGGYARTREIVVSDAQFGRILAQLHMENGTTFRVDDVRVIGSQSLDFTTLPGA